MSRKNKGDWLEGGLKILAKAGLKGLTIDKMALELGVTKGSFYHHFKNVRDFEEQLLGYWADQYLSTAGSIPEEEAELLPLLDTIMEETFSPITEPEIAIRMWAQQDEMARPYVEKVDDFRRKFVFEVFNSLTKDEQQAGLMADMLFTMTIGSMTSLPRVSPERVLELYRELKRLYRL
jgi:AcrR family transcriptional regulator